MFKVCGIYGQLRTNVFRVLEIVGQLRTNVYGKIPDQRV